MPRAPPSVWESALSGRLRCLPLSISGRRVLGCSSGRALHAAAPACLSRGAAPNPPAQPGRTPLASTCADRRHASTAAASQPTARRCRRRLRGSRAAARCRRSLWEGRTWVSWRQGASSWSKYVLLGEGSALPSGAPFSCASQGAGLACVPAAPALTGTARARAVASPPRRGPPLHRRRLRRHHGGDEQRQAQGADAGSGHLHLRLTQRRSSFGSGVLGGGRGKRLRPRCCAKQGFL